MKRASAVLVLFSACMVVDVGGQSHSATIPPFQVSAEDLLVHPVSANWPSYNGDYTGRRYSALGQIA